MKNNLCKQEILLMIDAVKPDFCGNDDPKQQRPFSHAEQLEEACWNGMLDELLGGIMAPLDPEQTFYIWQIRPRQAFLDIELSEYPQSGDNYLSIDPYLFLPEAPQN